MISANDEIKRKNDLVQRTKIFALGIIKLTQSLQRNRTTDVLAKQLLRSGTSVGANYRAACRARSRAEFISKLGIVEEEADESIYWLELLVESGIIQVDSVSDLLKEANELLAITIASIKTARQNR